MVKDMYNGMRLFSDRPLTSEEITGVKKLLKK